MEARFRTIKRLTGIRELRDRILIVCEGEKTEPNYFRKFPINKVVVEVDIKGPGYNTDSLVQEAIRLQEEANVRKTPFNQTWCVFDKDDHHPHNFNRAITIAGNNKIRVAYSNEAFELWYILHFEYYQARGGRADYIKKLNDLLGFPYLKNSEEMYDFLKKRQKVAIKFAKKLLDSYPRYDPLQNKPSTTVQGLVEELNKFL